MAAHLIGEQQIFEEGAFKPMRKNKFKLIISILVAVLIILAGCIAIIYVGKKTIDEKNTFYRSDAMEHRCRRAGHNRRILSPPPAEQLHRNRTDRRKQTQRNALARQPH